MVGGLVLSVVVPHVGSDTDSRDSGVFEYHGSTQTGLWAVLRGCEAFHRFELGWILSSLADSLALFEGYVA